MNVVLMSFGFKYGPPAGVQYLFDVRCLPNPHWVDHLQPKTGLDEEVAEYVTASDAGLSYLALLKPFLLLVVEQHLAAEKQQVVIGVGCTGGRHRSVAIVEVLKDILASLPVPLVSMHRDIDRDEQSGTTE